MREDRKELRFIRGARTRLHLDQIRPHGLERISKSGFLNRPEAGLQILPVLPRVAVKLDREVYADCTSCASR
jgi:hypothetical protein